MPSSTAGSAEYDETHVETKPRWSDLVEVESEEEPVLVQPSSSGASSVSSQSEAFNTSSKEPFIALAVHPEAHSWNDGLEHTAPWDEVCLYSEARWTPIATWSQMVMTLLEIVPGAATRDAFELAELVKTIWGSESSEIFHESRIVEAWQCSFLANAWQHLLVNGFGVAKFNGSYFYEPVLFIPWSQPRWFETLDYVRAPILQINQNGLLHVWSLPSMEFLVEQVSQEGSLTEQPLLE